MDPKVSSLGLSVLDEACDDDDGMDSLIAKKPELWKMGDQARNLLLRFCFAFFFFFFGCALVSYFVVVVVVVFRFYSRPRGLQFLKENNLLKQHLEIWKEKENLEYVNAVESELAEAFSPSLYKMRETEQQ